MRLEFVGAPTTGKSTIARMLREAGVGKPMWPGIKHPWVDLQREIRDFTRPRRFSIRLEQKVYDCLKVAHAHDQSTTWHVSDELCIQVGISLSIRAKGADWKWYFHSVPLPEMLILLKAKKETIRTRNAERGAKDRFAKSLRVMELIDEAMTILRNRGCKIIEFRTDKMPPEKIVKKILEAL